MLNKKMDDVCMTPHFGSLFPPTVNYQVVLTDILIELTKFNNFSAILPAFSRHLRKCEKKIWKFWKKSSLKNFFSIFFFKFFFVKFKKKIK